MSAEAPSQTELSDLEARQAFAEVYLNTATDRLAGELTGVVPIDEHETSTCLHGGSVSMRTTAVAMSHFVDSIVEFAGVAAEGSGADVEDEAVAVLAEQISTLRSSFGHRTKKSQRDRIANNYWNHPQVRELSGSGDARIPLRVFVRYELGALLQYREVAERPPNYSPNGGTVRHVGYDTDHPLSFS